MKWSDLPFAIEVSREGSAWRTVGRVKSLDLAVPAAAHLQATVYGELSPPGDVRVVEVRHGSRPCVVWGPGR